MIKVFTVSSNNFKNRQKNVIEQLLKEQITTKFQTYPELSDIKNKQLKKFDYLFLKEYNYKFLRKVINKISKKGRMSKKEITVFLKHFFIMTQQKKFEPIVILEDDIIIGKNFRNNLIQTLSQLPDDFAFCFFNLNDERFHVEERLYEKNKIIHKIDYFIEPNFKETSKLKTGKTRGTCGYIFNTQYGQLLLEEFNSQEKIYLPIDHWLNHFINKHNLITFWTEPVFSHEGSYFGEYTSEVR